MLFDIRPLEVGTCGNCKHRISKRCRGSYWSICELKYAGGGNKRVKTHQQGCGKLEKRNGIIEFKIITIE